VFVSLSAALPPQAACIDDIQLSDVVDAVDRRLTMPPRQRMKERLTAFLVRRRVTLGFVVAAAALLLARPTWKTWSAGLAIACAGEALRIWAAGHLDKSREVTRSGPYRWTRHPLYVGSSIMALGV
jgi:protein-S-isoprenylcysteine O-methyltransferase Ste14